MSKTWFITGVSSGIGRLLAEKALSRGDRVVGTSRNDEALPDLRDRHPERLRIVALDLKDPRREPHRRHRPDLLSVATSACARGRTDPADLKRGGQCAYPGFSLYHATKWGVEGFVEAVHQEVAAFGIKITLVEPGPARTKFGSNLVKTVPTPAYQDTPVQQLRDGLDGSWVIKGDPDRMTTSMLEMVDHREPLPRRLVLDTVRTTTSGRR